MLLFYQIPKETPIDANGEKVMKQNEPKKGKETAEDQELIQQLEMLGEKVFFKTLKEFWYWFDLKVFISPIVK